MVSHLVSTKFAIVIVLFWSYCIISNLSVMGSIIVMDFSSKYFFFFFPKYDEGTD